MNRANRAAQFQPFDALKGLQEELRIEDRSTIDLAKIGNTFTLNVGSSLTSINGELVNASINNVAFSSYSVSGSTLTLSADALHGVWGNANISLSYERKQGEQVIQAINVKVPVYIYRTINNAEELLALESYVTVNGLNAYGIFELTADIDLKGATFNGVGTWDQEWTHQFHGTFDGKGHTISNYVAGALNRGFMSCIARDGVVKNIIFENVTLPGMSGFVCTKNDGLVENVFVYAKTLEAGENWIPASAVVSKNNGTIRNVVVVLKDHNLYENGFGGGIAGWSNGTVENAILINLDSETLYAIGVNKELKETLSTDDYANARASVLSAYYTPKEVIEGMYSALERFGVKGNNKILEPAMGTGNFFGYMPKGIAENAKLYGVELDEITGKIATKLYPNANVQIKGFEQTTFPNNHFDIVVGNVPFGQFGVFDSDYAKENFYIHEYFIAKSIDKLKPNGIMAVITSAGTMDKRSQAMRKYVADLFDEYSPYMMWVFLATAGVWSIAMGISIIIATKNEDKVKAKKMLINYGIGLVVIFALLVAAPYLVRGIAALVS